MQSGGWVFFVVIGATFVEAEGTTTTFTSSVSTSVATATTGDPCVAATHPCVCANAHAECAWTTYANGGGVCQLSPGASVDCGLCPTQSACSSTTCGVHFDACSCANSPNWCYWDTGSNSCIARTAGPTPCSICSSQTFCDLPKPQISGYSPEHGKRKSDDDDVLQVTFGVNIKWCDDSARHWVLFWCSGSIDKSIEKSYLAIVLGNVLKADISRTLQSVSRAKERDCGLAIQAELLCDSTTSAPFNGLARGDYSFILRDTSAPVVATFNPSDGATGVDPNSLVEFTFDEPIELGPSSLYLTLTMLNTDRSGSSGTEASSKQYALELPYVRAKDANTLQFDIKGKTSPGWLYSIALPPGTVIDETGNEFLGLAGGTYTFRIAETSLRKGGADDSGGSSVGLIIALVVGILVCCCFVILLTVMARNRFCSNGIRYAKEPTTSTKQTPVPVTTKKYPQVQVDPTEPFPQSSTFFHGTPVINLNSPEGASGAQRKTSTTSKNSYHDFNPFQEDPEDQHEPYDEPFSREPSKEDHSRWGQPASSVGAKAAPKRAAQPAPRLYPEGGGHAGPQSTKKAGPKPQPQPFKRKVAPEPEPTPATRTSPLVESSCPEARAVEKKMRDMMNEPLAVRKKILKDLMLEYHPDKNAGDKAKEVFQFINGARAWFLHDA